MKTILALIITFLGVATYSIAQDSKENQVNIDSVLQQRDSASKAVYQYVEDSMLPFIEKKVDENIKTPKASSIKDLIELSYIVLPYDKHAAIGEILEPLYKKHTALFLKMIKEAGAKGDKVLEEVIAAIKESEEGNG